MAREQFEEVETIAAAKRCGVEWAPWMGDWFVSWSPRNSNSNAEGPWDHWVELALGILSDPLTQIVRPKAYISPELAGILQLYDQTQRTLTDEELALRFPDRED